MLQKKNLSPFPWLRKSKIFLSWLSASFKVNRLMFELSKLKLLKHACTKLGTYPFYCGFDKLKGSIHLMFVLQI